LRVEQRGSCKRFPLLARLEAPLGGHANALLRLSRTEDLHDELTVAVRHCVGESAFYREIGGLPPDAVDADFMLDCHVYFTGERTSVQKRPDDRVKRFIYRVVLSDGPTAQHAVYSLASECDVDVFDALFLNYLMWFGRLDLKVAAVIGMPRDATSPRARSRCLLDCLSRTDEPWEQIRLAPGPVRRRGLAPCGGSVMLGRWRGDR
jgi:hypothetical protein